MIIRTKLLKYIFLFFSIFAVSIGNAQEVTDCDDAIDHWLDRVYSSFQKELAEFGKAINRGNLSTYQSKYYQLFVDSPISFHGKKVMVECPGTAQRIMNQTVMPAKKPIRKAMSQADAHDFIIYRDFILKMGEHISDNKDVASMAWVCLHTKRQVKIWDIQGKNDFKKIKAIQSTIKERISRGIDTNLDIPEISVNYGGRDIHIKMSSKLKNTNYWLIALRNQLRSTKTLKRRFWDKNLKRAYQDTVDIRELSNKPLKGYWSEVLTNEMGGLRQEMGTAIEDLNKCNSGMKKIISRIDKGDLSLFTKDNLDLEQILKDYEKELNKMGD